MNGNGESEDRIGQIRSRIHNLADKVQTHEGQLIEHKTVIGMLTRELEAVRADCATREGMSDAFKVVAMQMEAAAQKTEMKIKQVEDKLDPIQRGIYWVVGLVLLSVIGAILTLVVQAGKP